MFKTQRLLVRPFKTADAPAFFDLTLDEGFRAFQITDYRQKDLAATVAWIRNVRGKYGVWDSASGVLVGMGGLAPWTWEGEALFDITYRFRESAWGRGLGQELARGLVAYGFGELGLAQITATITPDNVGSKKIAERVGFKFDKHILLLNVPTDLYRLYNA